MTVRLLDRDEELAALTGALSRARAGRGELVVVEASPGIGKSALLAAGRERARASGVRVLSARGSELERESPFGVMRQLIEPILAALAPSERARVVAGAAAPAIRLLGVDGAGPGEPATGFAAGHALYWVTAGLADGGPLLFTVDDAHWADASSLRALEHIARRAADLPITIITAFRPDEPGASNALLDALRATAAARLTPRALEPAAVAEIVRGRIPHAPEAVCRACHAATAGNPLYVTELLRALPAKRGGVEPAEVLATPVRFLGERVIRRVERVATDAPALAQAMAVLGDGARLAIAARLANLSDSVAGEIAHHLRRIEILAAEDPVAFVHPLIRASLYDAVAATDREGMHHRAAALLSSAGAPAEEVAAQVRQLTPGGDSAVARVLADAAETALQRGAVDEAIAYLHRALAEQAEAPPRADLLTTLGTARALARDPGAAAALTEAYQLASAPSLRARTGALLAEILGQAGRWSEAIAVVDSVQSERDVGDDELGAELEALRTVITLNDPAHVEDFNARRDAYARMSEGRHWGSYAVRGVLSAEAVQRGRVAEGVALAESTLADGTLFRQRGAGGWASPHPLGALILADELDRASAGIAALEEAARRSGSIFGQLTATGYRGWVHARRGELAAAEAQLDAVLKLAREAGVLMVLTTVAFVMCDVLLERDTEAGWLEALMLPPDFQATVSGAMLLLPRGRMRLRHRDRAAGIADLRAAGGIIDAVGFGPVYADWRSALAVALPATARAEAQTLITHELALARQIGLPRPIGIALRRLGTLEGDIERLRESVAVLEDSPARLEEARSLVALGAALRRANRRAEGRAVLVDGLTLALACGAHRLVRDAEQELRASGGRRPRQHASGREALTASELRVCQLASAGATNTEVAQDLYVSLKTVETHLSRAYSKLGLAGPGSRARLASALAPRAAA